MRFVRYILSLVVLVTLCFASSAQGILPEVNVKTLDGKTTAIAAEMQTDGLTILCFWATWCAPCKKELDAISDLYPDWEEDYNVKLLAISTDDARALPKVKPMVLEKDWPFTVLTDSNQELMRALQFQTVPQTFIIKGGAVVYSHSGYLPGDEDALEEELIKLSE